MSRDCTLKAAKSLHSQLCSGCAAKPQGYGGLDAQLQMSQDMSLVAVAFPRAEASCLSWIFPSKVKASWPLEAQWQEGGQHATGAEIRQFWAPGQNNLALPFAIPAG